MKTESDKKRILYIGDSHSVLSFGDHFRGNLIKHYGESLELHQYAVSGSHLLHWFEGGLSDLQIRNLKFVSGGDLTKSPVACNFKIEELIREIRPDELIIALGTNDLIFLNEQVKGVPYQRALASISTLVEKAIWILPPRMGFDVVSSSLQSDYNALISKNFTRALDSSGFSPDQSDGIHFFQALAISWADSIWTQYLA